MKRMGRPPLGRKAKTVFIGLRITPEELARWKRAARAAGTSLSGYILKPRREESNP